MAKLLIVSPQERLGGGADFTGHPFFATTSFVDLEQKRLAAPFLPTIRGAMDLSNVVAQEKDLCGMGAHEWALREQECIDAFNGF